MSLRSHAASRPMVSIRLQVVKLKATVLNRPNTWLLLSFVPDQMIDSLNVIKLTSPSIGEVKRRVPKTCLPTVGNIYRPTLNNNIGKCGLPSLRRPVRLSILSKAAATIILWWQGKSVMMR